ncbi:MAG: hypothetical protein ACYCT1_08125 [Steroidobacteraceae bacterium]
MTKDLREIMDEAERQGWRVRRVGDGFMLLAPSGAGAVTIHGTESDRHALANTIARLRRYGFGWPPDRKGKKG